MRCAQHGDDSFVDPHGEEEGCLAEGCCRGWCQCFMGYGFYRDCGADRVWDTEKFACVEQVKTICTFIKYS